MSQPVAVSVVLPVYNELDNLTDLHQQLVTALDALALPYEIIFVDDGSRDGSREALRELATSHAATRALLFRRNFGQTAAMQAGFDAASGDVVIPLDADLQNDPADIPRLLAKLDEGYDIVSGWRREREDNWLRTLPSRLANRLIQRVTGVPIHDTGCTLKAYRRHTLEPLRLYGQLHRFVPALATAYGARVGEIEVKHHPRTRGQSKYGIGRTTKVIVDLMLVKFLQVSIARPLHAFGRWALLSLGLSLLLTLIGLCRLPAGAAGQWLLAALLCSGFGFQLIATGMVAELLTRTYHESTGRRTYLIAEDLGAPDPAPGE